MVSNAISIHFEMIIYRILILLSIDPFSLSKGGIMAGHDYTLQDEPDTNHDPDGTGQDWTLNYDGSRDHTRRVVKGAVVTKEFF